ncbi:MAG: Do family serine endopeptidase [Planctomycetaceae bacterium]|nr:Do family serine endopeptidase [Planctomycetaceae bacterium]
MNEVTQKQTRWGHIGTPMVTLITISGLSLALLAAVTIGEDRGQPVDSAAIRPAIEVANSFRAVAQSTFPGIVAIETRGKAMAAAEGMDLGELFKGDPRFERFFEMNPQLKPRQEKTPRRQIVPQGQGSGFIFDTTGLIMTNNHVVADAEEIMVRLHDGREYKAELVGTDPRSDVAVIKIDAKNLQAIPLGNSDEMEVGDWVLAFGSPFGLELTMTQGIISAKGRGPGINEREDYLQTDAAINPGNSGGPLVNLRGEVIGINTAISSRSGGYDGVGFSIPINMARWISDQLVDSGRVKRAYIGVIIQPVTNDLANQLGLSVNQGAIVNQVMPESPSDNAKVETGDVILKLNGKPVNGTRQLQGIVEQLEVGKSYPLVVYRDGKEQKLNITMAEMPEDLSLKISESVEEADRGQDSSAMESKDLGISVQALTDDLAQEFGYPGDVNGVIIAEVKPDSIAEQNGLQVGELIEKVGTTQITSLEDFETATKDLNVKKGVLMLVRRGNLTRFLVVKER